MPKSVAKKEKTKAPVDTTKFLDQMLEDMAGDEFDEFEESAKGYSFGGSKRTNFEESDCELHDL